MRYIVNKTILNFQMESLEPKGHNASHQTPVVVVRKIPVTDFHVAQKSNDFKTQASLPKQVQHQQTLVYHKTPSSSVVPYQQAEQRNIYQMPPLMQNKQHHQSQFVHQQFMPQTTSSQGIIHKPISSSGIYPSNNEIPSSSAVDYTSYIVTNTDGQFAPASCAMSEESVEETIEYVNRQVGSASEAKGLHELIARVLAVQKEMSKRQIDMQNQLKHVVETVDKLSERFDAKLVNNANAKKFRYDKIDTLQQMKDLEEKLKSDDYMQSLVSARV